MDRNGDRWTGDGIDTEARGNGASSGGNSNRDVVGESADDGVSRQRSIDTVAGKSVRLDDDGEAATTTTRGGAAGESD